MKKLFLFLLLVSCLSFRPTNNDLDIFFGDSITFGNELGSLQYTHRWSTQYCNAVPSDEINRALSGAAMTPGVAPLGRPTFNINDVPGYQGFCRHIFISYWVNDYLYSSTPAAFAAATAAAVDGIIARGWPAAKIVLCFNYLPESGTNWPYMTHAKAQQWLAALRGVQQAKGTSFLDFYTLIYNRPDKDTYAPDGIHPSPAWNAIMKQYAQTNIEGPSTTLPVSIVNFSGLRQGAASVLKWTVAQEQNVDRYEIERSADGTAWTKAGEVASLGNAAAQRSYTFTDNGAAGLKQLYRLLAVDKNGTAKFSNVVIINGTKSAQLSLSDLFPNPAVSKLNLVVNAPAKETLTVELADALGRTVQAQKAAVEAGTNTVDVNTTAIKAGVYFVRLISQNGAVSGLQKFVKQ